MKLQVLLCFFSSAWLVSKAGDLEWSLRGSSSASLQQASQEQEQPVSSEDNVSDGLSSENISCHTAVPNESCWDEILWAMSTGISEHADWYKGLNASSSVADFQCVVYYAHPDKCAMPCNVSCPLPSVLEGPTSILHISDTHSMHRTTDLPPADILIHTGDLTDRGLDEEFGDFNEWLGSIKSSYKYIFVIPGNHDWWAANAAHQAEAIANPTVFIQQRVTHATVLHHEIANVMGLKIWGAGWTPMSSDAASGNFYDDIPTGIDVLVTHDPPHGIFDSAFVGHWGSSRQLLAAVQRVKPKVHLFGHVHEQQGLWQKLNGRFEGGVTYHPDPASAAIFKENPQPSPEYPPELIINGAMANQAGVDHAYTGRWEPMHLRGPYHRIVAERQSDDWHFAVDGAGLQG